MTITNPQSGTNIHEISQGIYRINTPIPPSQIPGGFSFNQYLIIDDEPLLFHTGPRKMFPLVREAVASVLPVENLKYISCSHFEADECGSINEWLAVAPHAVPLGGRLLTMISLNDVADRPAKTLKHQETLSLGNHSVTWIDAAHLPHAWECGFLMENTTKTLLCGDLFTQSGDKLPALTESDILEPSEESRKKMDYFSHTRNVAQLMEPLIQAKPTTLACMHGSAWRGDGERLLRDLSVSLAK